MLVCGVCTPKQARIQPVENQFWNPCKVNLCTKKGVEMDSLETKSTEEARTCEV